MVSINVQAILKIGIFFILVTFSTSSPELEHSAEEGERFAGPIRICRKGTDAEINVCFRKILKDIKPRLAEGIPEIGLQPLDPLHINRLKFSQGSGALKIKATFTNISVLHLSKFEDAEFKIDSAKRILPFIMEFPKLKLSGTYRVGGNIFVFPLAGSGPFVFDLGDVLAKGFCSLNLVKNENGTSIVQIGKVNLDLKIKDIKVSLFNLFNGNEIIGPVINNVINENVQELFREIKPEIIRVINKIVKDIANAIIKNMPFLADLLKSSSS